jgi:uncharacterized protein (DUF1499 family)
MIKILSFIAFFATALAGIVVLAGQIGMVKGKAPQDLGVQGGRLKRPSFSPNSVSSQAGLYPDHPQKKYAEIAPFEYTGDGPAAMQRLAEVLSLADRITVVEQTPDYIYAQANTQLMKFTDDLEFWLDPANRVIQVRSASRLGRKDFGVNRERMESIRSQFISRQ